MLNLGSVTAGGDHRQQVIWPDNARVIDTRIIAKDVYPDGQVRLSATVRYGAAEVGGMSFTGPVIMGSTMYDTSYLRANTGAISQKRVTRVGPGWQVYRSLDRSTYVTATKQRTTEYSLRNDGTLYRRNVTYKDGVPSRQITGWQSGYRGVKAMTLISQTATYDTFLMTLTSGKLYTARLPLAGGQLIPGVVKQVRSRTWQGFESLVAAPCGTGTLLLGIDKDSGSAYLYSMGHANGPVTTIRMIGKVPGTFKDPVYFLLQEYNDQRLSGD